MFIKIRHALSLIILLLSVSLIVWALLPNPHQIVTQSILSAEMRLPSSVQVSSSSMMETRQVMLKYPNSMRIGETEEITLVFEPVEDGVSSSNAPAISSDIYYRYNIMTEASFGVTGIWVSPANPTRESMPAGQAVKFRWQISTDRVGSFAGTLWLSLRFLPLDGSQASQVPIFIRDVEIRTSSLFGLNQTMAYLFGGVGMVLATGIVFDDIIAFARRWMKKSILKESVNSAQCNKGK
jgi:hypothetical protein